MTERQKILIGKLIAENIPFVAEQWGKFFRIRSTYCYLGSYLWVINNHIFSFSTSKKILMIMSGF